MMEAMQCGLNRNMMIQKREIFRDCFDGVKNHTGLRSGHFERETLPASPSSPLSRR